MPDALDLFKTALECAPNHKPFLREAVIILRDMGRIHDACDFFEEWGRVNPVQNTPPHSR